MLKEHKLWLIGLVGFSVLAFVCFALLHEGTHAVIFSEYGCSNITFHMHWLGATTDADCANLQDEFMQASVLQSQATVEAFQYPFIIVLILLVSILFEIKSPLKHQ